MKQAKEAIDELNIYIAIQKAKEKQYQIKTELMSKLDMLFSIADDNDEKINK